MKKLLSTVYILLISATASFAQMSIEAGWQKTQLVATTTESDGYKSYLYTWADGFYAGVSSYYDIPVNGLSFKYAILYNYVTGRESDALKLFADPHYEVAKGGEVITDEHYISVPGVLDLSLKLADNFNIYFYGGPQVVYCLSSKTYATWAGLDGTNRWNVDHFAPDTNYNGYRRFDLGLLGGLGFEIAKTVRVEFGVDYGFLDRSKTRDRLNRISLHAGVAILFR
ncbi:MAG: outer membrane beta-barrel protein [Bacteroidales bacterium]|nr:outer membrane beta-barrel protein [Bacteroidales bacterium]